MQLEIFRGLRPRAPAAVASEPALCTDSSPTPFKNPAHAPGPFCPFCLCLFSVFFVQDSVLGTKWTILGTKGTKGTKILDKWDKKLDKLKCRECIYSTRHQQFRFSCQCFAVLRINWNHWRDWNKQNSSTAYIFNLITSSRTKQSS